MAEDTKTRSKPRRRRGSGNSEEQKRKASRRRNGKGATEEVKDTADSARNEAPDVGAGDVADTAGEAGSQSRTVTSEIKDVVREAAIDVLKPVAKKATTQAAKFAITKGPELFQSGIMDKVGDAGGPKAIAEGAMAKGSELVSKVKGDDDEDGGGDSKPEGVGKGRRLPVQEHVDVGVDIETVYNQWTQFEEFPKFMHRVEKVDQRDETHLMWTEKIWGVRRQWEAEILAQRPNERIAWKSLDGSNNVGVVTFHALSDTLTRVQVNLDHQPHGLFEKTSSGFRMTRRALKSDLMRFKAFIEMRDEETGEWRGEIRDGDLVDESERDDERDERDEELEDEPRAESDEYEDEGDEEYVDDEEDEDDDEPSMSEEDEDDDEPSMSEDDEDEEDEPSMSAADDEEYDEEEEEDEPEPEPEPKKAPRRRTRAKSTNGKSPSRSKSTSRSKSKSASKSKPRAKAKS
jgi:uncharacterized membrane protein